MTIKITNIQHKFRNKYIKYAAGTSDNISSVSSNNVENKFDNYFYEDDNGNLHSRLSFVGDKEISAYGVGDDSGSGSVTIIDNLLSNATDCALSANQGRVLNEKIQDIIEQGVGVTSWDDLEDKPSLLTDENIQKWNTQTHTHSNKTVLDVITSAKTTNWDSAYTHISDNTKHITSTERTNWNTAYNNNHTHSNKSVLDGITSTKVSNWDGVVTNWNKAFYFDSNNNLRVKLNLVGEGEVSAYGAGTSGTGIITIVDNLTSTATDCALSANQGRVLKGLIDSKVSSWNDIKDKPSTFTPSSHTHTISQITDRTGLLTALSSSSTTNLSITVGGTTKSIADLYATQSDNADKLDGQHSSYFLSKYGVNNTSPGGYVTNDTHILQLGYMVCGNSYDSLTLQIQSAFWGNQHGSSDIISISQDTNNDSTSAVQYKASRLKIGNTYQNRIFYAKADNTNKRLYLYVYVTGGNGYGRWVTQIISASRTNMWVSEIKTNQPSSDLTIIQERFEVDTISNADKLDGVHLNGLFTALSSTSSTNLSATIGGVTKTVADLYATQAVNADTVDNYHAIGASGNIIKKRGYTGGSTTPYWYRLAKYSTTNTENNTDVAFFLHSSFDKRYGILLIRLRGGEYVDSYFLVSYGMNTTKIRVYYDSTKKNVELYYYASENYSIMIAELLYNTHRNGNISNDVIMYENNNIAPSYSTYINPTFFSIQNNSASATKLQTARTIWGQSFNGTANVSGNMTGVGSISASGNIVAGGEITAYSDARLKTNIQTLEDRGYITPVTYIKDNKRSIGFLAQEVREKYPELVTEDSSKEKYLSLNYAQYTAVLQAQIIELNNRIKQLESKL